MKEYEQGGSRLETAIDYAGRPAHSYNLEVIASVYPTWCKESESCDCYRVAPGESQSTVSCLLRERLISAALPKFQCCDDAIELLPQILHDLGSGRCS